jgi:TonB family protein
VYSRTLAFALALALFVPFEALASQPTPLPKAPPADSGQEAAKGPLGIYLTSSSPTERVVLESPARDVILVLGPPRWEAVGFLSDNQFVGVLRRTDSEGRALADSALGTLRFEMGEPGTIRARGEFPRGQKFEALWKLLKQSRAEDPPRPEPVSPPGERRDPRYGEYVHTDELPELITRVAPVYPQLAREAGVEGKVLVQALVGVDGIVKDTRVVSGAPMLKDAAEQAVRQYRFKPALEKGSPVACWVAIPVAFSLH